MFLLLYLAAAAIGAPLTQPDLDLNGLIREALDRNPDVLAAQKRYEAARQRPRQERALPEPTISVGYASNGRPWPGAGLGVEPTSNIGVMVTQEFPFFGKRKLRGEIAQKEAQAEFDQYQSVQLAVVSRLKQAYYRLAYTYRARDVVERNRDLLVKLQRVAEVRYSIGRAAQQDILKIETQLSILETRLIQLDRERAAREAEILSLLNRRPGELGGKAVMAVPKPLRKSLEELFALAGANAPQLQRDRRMIERSQLALNLARKDSMPDYAISGGYANMGRMPDMYQFRLDLKLPAWFGKQRAAQAEQSLELRSAQRMLESTAQSLAFRVKDDYLMAETSLRLMQAYERAVVPQAGLALESSLASYETAAVDLLSVLTNFITVVEYEMNYYEEMLNFYLAASRLEEAVAERLIEEDRP
jgi:outer membrane protein TolC